MTGSVKWFNSQKGYGFIAGDDGTDAFVHYSSILANGYKALDDGQRVCYDAEQCDRGMKAINVVVVCKDQ